MIELFYFDYSKNTHLIIFLIEEVYLKPIKHFIFLILILFFYIYLVLTPPRS